MKIIRNNILNLLFTPLILLISGCEFTKPIDFVLKNKNEGRYAVIYDCKSGKDKQYKSKRLQHVFPENNILVLSYPQSSGITDYKFYYYENGKKIEFFMPHHKKADSSFLAYGPTRITTKTYSIDFFYFGSKPNDEGNKEFFNFEEYVFDYIQEQNLNCGDNH